MQSGGIVQIKNKSIVSLCNRIKQDVPCSHLCCKSNHCAWHVLSQLVGVLFITRQAFSIGSSQSNQNKFDPSLLGFFEPVSMKNENPGHNNTPLTRFVYGLQALSFCCVEANETRVSAKSRKMCEFVQPHAVQTQGGVGGPYSLSIPHTKAPKTLSQSALMHYSVCTLLQTKTTVFTDNPQIETKDEVIGAIGEMCLKPIKLVFKCIFWPSSTALDIFSLHRINQTLQVLKSLC